MQAVIGAILLVVGMVVGYRLWIALASLWQTLLEALVREAYLVVFGIIGAVSAVLLAMTGRAVSEVSRR